MRPWNNFWTEISQLLTFSRLSLASLNKLLLEEQTQSTVIVIWDQIFFRFLWRFRPIFYSSKFKFFNYENVRFERINFNSTEKAFHFLSCCNLETISHAPTVTFSRESLFEGPRTSGRRLHYKIFKWIKKNLLPLNITAVCMQWVSVGKVQIMTIQSQYKRIS